MLVWLDGANAVSDAEGTSLVKSWLDATDGIDDGDLLVGLDRANVASDNKSTSLVTS